MDIEDKITKIEAVIARTTHEGERESALLARSRLLKKRRGKPKSKKAYGKERTQKQKDQEAIDPFFLRGDVYFRSSKDERDATQKQKDFIRFLVDRADLACPNEKLDHFLDQMGLKQASYIIKLLLELFGEPKNDPLTDNQYYFLMKRKDFFGLSQELIDHLTTMEASIIIEAVEVIEEKGFG